MMLSEDIDRAATTLALFDMSDRFIHEAAFIDQTNVETARLCMDIATRLSMIAKCTLSHGSLEVAQGYLDAGELTLAFMQEARR